MCGDEFYFCTCHNPAGHDGNHECDCNGSWSQERQVVGYPDLPPSLKVMLILMSGSVLIDEQGQVHEGVQ